MAPSLATCPTAAYGRFVRGVRRLIVVCAIGIATAWMWIRLGLYGFGPAVGVLVLAPAVLLGVGYVRTGRLGHFGGLLGAFAAAWAAFEAWTWLNAVTDPAVSIPGWTPIPLATAVALFVVASALLVAAWFEAG